MLKKSCIKINAIILAAGNSSRFNGNKLLSIYNEKPLAMHIIEKSFGLDIMSILFVLPILSSYKQHPPQLTQGLYRGFRWQVLSP